jgi:hypothetical protein
MATNETNGRLKNNARLRPRPAAMNSVLTSKTISNNATSNHAIIFNGRNNKLLSALGSPSSKGFNLNNGLRPRSNGLRWPRPDVKISVCANFRSPLLPPSKDEQFPLRNNALSSSAGKPRFPRHGQSHLRIDLWPQPVAIRLLANNAGNPLRNLRLQPSDRRRCLKAPTVSAGATAEIAIRKLV